MDSENCGRENNYAVFNNDIDMHIFGCIMDSKIVDEYRNISM
jgi:hypothetical protein